MKDVSGVRLSVVVRLTCADPDCHLGCVKLRICALHVLRADRAKMKRPPQLVSRPRDAPLTTDLETDSKIQDTIHREFEGKTLLCIAHRLRTIMSWDRILVMEAGEVGVSVTDLVPEQCVLANAGTGVRHSSRSIR